MRAVLSTLALCSLGFQGTAPPLLFPQAKSVLGFGKKDARLSVDLGKGDFNHLL